LTEGWICRRKIEWLPTEQAIQAIRDVFGDKANELRPRWASDEEKGPLFGDPNELLHHRKGVELAGHKMISLPWVKTVTFYRTDPASKEVADLFVRTIDEKSDWQVEVLTKNHNIEQWISKWEQFKGFRKTWWVFESRSTMCSFFNAVHDRTSFVLDGGAFTEPYNNWSSQAVTQKLRRSKDPNPPFEDAGDLAHTITGMLEADKKTVTDWFDE
jgi:hypothetical protein